VSCVLYAEVPRFYAEVERARDLALADRPVVVGGDPRKRGLVQAATADALAAGVEPGMEVLVALQRCPQARSLRTNMRRYREASSQLRASLRRVLPRLEPDGLGAAFLDPGRAAQAPRALALALREAVEKELGLPLRVGIAPVKFLARLAAEEAGPEGVREVSPEAVAAFLHPLPVTRLPGVGPRTAAVLAGLGARCVGDLLGLGRPALEKALGNHGLAILEAARGSGESRVRAASHPRSLSLETTLAAPERDLGVLGERVVELAQRLADALRLDALAARRVTLKIRYQDHETCTRSQTLARAVARAPEVEAAARELLGRTQAGSRPVRLLGLGLAGLARVERDEAQLALFRDLD
jgi:DNA polymerase-4